MHRMHTNETQAWLADHDPLPVVALHDEVVDALGHDPRSDYAETYWLPVIGPSSLWALRRLVGWLDASPAGYPVPLAPMARELGLGEGTSRTAPLIRTLARLVVFELAAVQRDVLAVRRVVPPLAHRHVLRLPAHLAERHRVEVEAALRTAPSSRHAAACSAEVEAAAR